MTKNPGIRYFLIFLVLAILAVASYFYLSASTTEEVEQMADESEQVLGDTSLTPVD